METKRANAMKINKILRLAIIVLIILTMATWLLPYFSYNWADYGLSKGVKNTTSLWGYFLMPTNFLQMEKLLNVKYVNMSNLNVCLAMVISAIFAIVVCIRKRSIWVNLFPLIFSLWGLIGYFTNSFLLLGNHTFSRLITIVLLALTLIATVINTIFHTVEIKNRPADYYLPAADF